MNDVRLCVPERVCNRIGTQFVSNTCVSVDANSFTVNSKYWHLSLFLSGHYQ